MSNNNEILIMKNIKNYKYNFSTRDIIVSKYDNDNDNDNDNDKSYYFIIDSGSNDNYYLIYESFIFIQLLIDLNNNNKDKDIKILTNSNNNNILKSLLNFFNIDNKIVNDIDNYNNITYSPVIYSIYYNQQLNNDTYYNHHLNIYLNHINNNLDNNVKNIENIIITEHNIINNDNGIILETNIKNIKNIFSIMNKAKKIYIHYNSYFFYNCIWLKNKNINIIENNLYRPNGIYTQISGNPFLKYLYNIINNNNTINIIKN
jgi:hypothetical protein